ncbi:hypothetical protein TgHK011_005683 [Trichoderma gracile]|nr:hypothetical protein TgHK011_005683 [Trichoderma gracile]
MAAAGKGSARSAPHSSAGLEVQSPSIVEEARSTHAANYVRSSRLRMPAVLSPAVRIGQIVRPPKHEFDKGG